MHDALEELIVTIEQLINKYEPMIFSIMRKLSIYKNYEDFHQVGQIALWQAFQRYDDSRGHFAPFAYRSIYGAMLDEMNRQNRSIPEVSTEDHILEEVTPSITYDDTFTIDELLNELQLNERQLLYNLYIAGYSYKEIAAKERVTPAAIQKRRQRIIRKLRTKKRFFSE